MNSRKFVKTLCNEENLKYKDMVEILSEKTGKSYTYQSLYGKISRNSLTLTEAYILADALGYDLTLAKRKK